jgi:hypothetical protein
MLHVVACCLARCMSLFSLHLPAAWRMLSGCCLLHACRQVVRCIFPVAYCMSSVTFSPMHVACCRWSVAHFPVVVCGIAVRWIVSACPFFVACRTVSVAGGLISVARPRVPCRMVCAVRRRSHVASRHVARCMTRALRRMLSLVRCLSRLARCLLQPSVARCRVTQSRRARSASRRRLQFRAQ